MGRAIGAVVVGYLTMFVIVFTVLTGAYLALGTDGAFQPGTYNVSSTWVVVWFVAGFAAAIAGGYVCVSVARRPKPAFVLAGVVFVLGILSTLPKILDATEQKERGAEVSNFDAMMQAREPTWMLLMNPIIGAFGVLVGARMNRS